MNEELTHIKSIWNDKTAAKDRVMKALGKALLADKGGNDSQKDWQEVEDYGLKNGVEGRKNAEMLDACDAYVAAHGDEFNLYRGMELEDLVKTLEVFRDAGLEEQAWRVQVWLTHHFEPQHVGGKARAIVRIPGRDRR